MLLHSRIVTFRTSPRKLMPWALGITEYVNTRSSVPVSLWMADYGYPIGTLSWSALLESQAQLAQALEPLAGDDGYHDLLDAAAAMVDTAGQDMLREVVYGAPGEVAPVGSTAIITTATATVECLPEAIGWSIDIAQHLESLTGNGVTVLTNVFGQMGGITWISTGTLEAGEVARAQSGADATYIGKLAATKELFISGSGHTSRFTRVA